MQKQVEVSASGTRDTAVFAGGCFWGIELAFQRVPGVVKTEVGYAQGLKKDPTYEEVCSGQTGKTIITFKGINYFHQDILKQLK